MILNYYISKIILILELLFRNSFKTKLYLVLRIYKVNIKLILSKNYKKQIELFLFNLYSKNLLIKYYCFFQLNTI